MKRNYFPKIVGSIVRPTSQSYLDQIDGVTVVSSKKIKDYLFNKYELSVEEYYNLVVYGNINHITKCENPKCTNKSGFISLSSGYQKYCCRKCCDSYPPLIKSNKIPWSDERRLRQSKNNRKIQLDKVKNKTHNFLKQSIEHKLNAQLQSARFTFIKRAKIRNIDKSYLYLGIDDSLNKIKIGITFVGIERRKYDLNLFSIHTILIGTPELVSEIEYEVKRKFMNVSSNDHEKFDFNQLKEVINFIKIFKSSRA